MSRASHEGLQLYGCIGPPHLPEDDVALVAPSHDITAIGANLESLHLVVDQSHCRTVSFVHEVDHHQSVVFSSHVHEGGVTRRHFHLFDHGLQLYPLDDLMQLKVAYEEVR